jgi:D-alanyl-D-alanine carboxypeptidase
VAVVVLQLIKEKKLALEDTVNQHLPESVYHDIDDAKLATVKQLLSHTAGIDSWEDDPVWQVDMFVDRRRQHLNLVTGTTRTPTTLFSA